MAKKLTESQKMERRIKRVVAEMSDISKYPSPFDLDAGTSLFHLLFCINCNQFMKSWNLTDEKINNNP